MKTRSLQITVLLTFLLLAFWIVATRIRCTEMQREFMGHVFVLGDRCVAYGAGR